MTFWKQNGEADEIAATRPPPTYDNCDTGIRWSRRPRSMTLRPYQEDALQAITDALDNGLNRVGVSSPTGSGKTVIFASLIPRIPEDEQKFQVLVLVHNIELARQAQSAIESLYRGKYLIGLEQGGNRTEGDREMYV